MMSLFQPHNSQEYYIQPHEKKPRLDTVVFHCLSLLLYLCPRLYPQVSSVLKYLTALGLYYSTDPCGIIQALTM